MLNAGILNQRVRIERHTQVGNDPRYGPIKEWQSVDVVWAAVVQDSAAETSSTPGTISSRSYTLRMRRQPDLTEKDRIVVVNSGMKLDIVGIVDEGHVSQRITAREYRE
jgi:SPP1 family predicted phage head-tail adaptor